MDLNLNGQRVQSILIEYTVVFTLSGDHFIVIESPFRLERGSDVMVLSPEEDPDEALHPIRELKGLTIDEARIGGAGDLHVRFSDGTKLFVAPDDAYEAWNVSGPNGFLIVCTPGGELARWSGD